MLDTVTRTTTYRGYEMEAYAEALHREVETWARLQAATAPKIRLCLQIGLRRAAGQQLHGTLHLTI